MENPIKMDDLGVPLFLETPICIPCVERFLALCQVAIFCLPWALLVSGAAVGSDVLNGPVDVLAETALGNVAQILELEYSALQGIRNTGSTLGCSPFL